MREIEHVSLHVPAEGNWIWNNKEKILYLYPSGLKELDIQLICDIVHKLMFLSPKKVIIHLENCFYGLSNNSLYLMKNVSMKINSEKTDLYRIILEKISNEDLDSDFLRGKISIRPIYGDLYLKNILRSPISVNLFSEYSRRNIDYIFKKNLPKRFSYVTGHLAYFVSVEKRFYGVFFYPRDYLWVEKELSSALRLVYSKKMLKSGRLRDILNYRFNIGLKLIDILINEPLNNEVKMSLVKHAAYSSIGLSKFYPLLKDENVQCFFLDDVGQRIYVDHAEFGRLNTNLVIRHMDLESFLTLVKRESGLNLDYSRPSIKASVDFEEIPTRVSIDIPPVTLGRGVIDVRKHRTRVFSLKELLASRSFSEEYAAFLIFSVLNRANISIIGEPNSGKTSLLNFLSYFMPPWWRIVHIEDSLETLPHRIMDQHRIVYIVEPFETIDRKSTKTLEIIKVLHRTPSYLILGEVQSSGHIKAMFQAISAGLRIIHTAHALNSEGFIKRLVEVYKIPPALIPELDLIVVMKKIESRDSIRRFIDEVVEVEDASTLRKLFSRELRDAGSLFDLKMFEKLSCLNNIGKDALYDEYREIKTVIANNSSLENDEIRKYILKIHARMLNSRSLLKVDA
ncbi:MAG: ATPase, T2SS/T4P/T4SS family [Thermoproteota archaeon]